MAIKKTRAETETVIRRSADEATWDVFSEDPKVIRKLERLYGQGKNCGHGFRWEIPPAGISIRKPRELTAEQREKLILRARSLHG